MLDKTWKTLAGDEVKDLAGTIRELALTADREVHIGTDSIQTKRDTQFVTVVVVLVPGKGGRAFYTKERVPRIRSLRERLLKEVWTSVQLGMELHPALPENVGMTIHVDANPDVRFKSSTYVQELAGMVVAQGFKTLLKPDSWCATHAADHVVREVVGR